ncbi:MAG: hypothetical protein A2Y12_19365 [Planctomycetes bacterium GWF2_42_9]|nr:MAG: hypothetical protein A2Y12_19365 [Planctomycetes bacterium GWF2_42_9]HAL45665.1 hypothetical protein [Phycisphaerales bacterium]
MDCTIKKYLKIVPGTVDDYQSLSRFHYRPCELGPVAAVYKIIDTHPARQHIEPLAGVIIYSMPVCSIQLRNIATQGLFTKLGSSSVNMQLVNQNIRNISRVVIEPRYRALGLAYDLVQKTMPMLNVPYIEAQAVMGKINPFFEKAGMMKYEAPEGSNCAKLRQALSIVGVDEADMVDIELVQSKLDRLGVKAKDFIENQITGFLSKFGRRIKNLPAGLKRTEYIIGKLSERPVYYLWRNAKVKLKI